ncbi:hypothetical protein QUA00_03505 [Microcoleus sp. T2B6]|uniref:hypothetical protein n=1 Tax=unclassified Microcoleus TaxID=2642155 RepID=UPI002FD0ADAB
MSTFWGASHLCSQARNWSFEAGGRRQEAEGKRKKERGRRKEPEEGRSQKKYFYKYEMLPLFAIRSQLKSSIALRIISIFRKTHRLAIRVNLENVTTKRH